MADTSDNGVRARVASHRNDLLGGGNLSPTDRVGDYYQRLRRRLPLSLVIAYVVPILILSGYFHYQFTTTLKDSGKLHLRALAESQATPVDLFLQERVSNIFNLFHNKRFNLEPTQEDMRRYLDELRAMSDAFIDVGFFDDHAVQIGYAGPHRYLEGRDYSDEAWFKALQTEDQSYYISDIYLGFRQEPHFTIAVRQRFNGKPYVMRATLDPVKFNQFLLGLSKEGGVASAIVNREGRYQVVDPAHGELLATSPYGPNQATGSGAREARSERGPILVAHCWLKMAPWALIVAQPLDLAYSEMYSVRRIMIISTALVLAVTVSVIWLTTDRLLRKAQATSARKEELRSQLIHASKLASVGELAAGVAHEINNPLAIIASEAGLIRDMLDPQYGMDSSPESIGKELQAIEAAVFRARNITQKMLTFVRKDEPKLAWVDLNKLIDDAVGGIKEHQFEVSNIELVREYDPDLPEVHTDPDQVEQVILNIINNAGDAIGSDGTITVTTRADDEENIRVTVTDTGCGMSSEHVERIFDPFFTTKEVGKGTGLGLSVSLSIVKAMGGRLEVQSVPGAGSSFTIVLPIEPHAVGDAR